MNSKQAESPETKSALNKMDKLYSDLKLKFEENLKHIKNLTSNLKSSFVLKSEVKEKPRAEELQQELMEDVEIQEITDQEQLVKEREMNLREMDSALNNIHNMSEKIYEITMEDDLKINSIMKQQKNHSENVETKLMADINRTSEANRHIRNKIAFFGFIAVLLALGLAGVYYMTRKHN